MRIKYLLKLKIFSVLVLTFVLILTGLPVDVSAQNLPYDQTTCTSAAVGGVWVVDPNVPAGFSCRCPNNQAPTAQNTCPNAGSNTNTGTQGSQQVQINPTNVPKVGLGNAEFREGLQFAFAALGAISVVVVTYNGLRYTLSNGDPTKIRQAQDGIVYALVGAVVGALGFSITTFVLSTTVSTATGENALFETMASLARLFAIVTGAVSIIMIIIGGFRFVTSNGDPVKTASARTTIIYALIGAVIAGIAGPIVVTVLSRF